MQLNDREIREILLREKRNKIRKQRIRRRIILLAAVIIIAVLVIMVRSQIKAIEDENREPRGVIFIDPGHGGEDPGSDNGSRREKDDTLALALAVRDCLKAEGFKVVLSREDDVTVDRTRRGEMANECHAQLMISIHRNKAPNGGDGVEVFIPLADDEGSRKLGENIMQALVEAGFSERTVRAGTLTSADEDYEEIAASDMPSCLVEVGFISSDHDNDLFDRHLDDIAKAISGAVTATFDDIYGPPDEAE